MNVMIDTILIIGASGYLGSLLYKRCSANETVKLYGTCCSSASNNQLFKLNVLDTENARNFIKNINPDIVVWSLMNENEEVKISEVGLANILSILSEDVRFIYISTLVSSEKNQNEDVTPEKLAPKAYHANYVNGKIRGEELVKTHKNHVIIRPGQIFGFDVNGQPDKRMKRVLEEKKTGEKLYRTENSHISIIHNEDLVKCIIELFYNDFVGVINIAAEQPYSYYDFYKLLARMLEIDGDIIAPEFAEIPSDSFFDTTKCKTVFSTQMQKIYI